jgi:hypothetical protein
MGMRTKIGVFATVVAAIMAVFLGGCGGSVKGDNSGYRGAYADPGNTFVVNGRAEVSGSPAFTVSEKGNMIGSVRFTDESLGSIEGFFQNNGDFGATLKKGDKSYPISGKFSRQQVPTIDLVTGKDPVTNQYKTIFESGLAGNFRITIDGVIYDGTFSAPGGVTQ